jgi:hypothetical protein
MSYAILQKSLEVPAIDQLKRAFRSVRSLTDIDAHILANDAFGILVRNLSGEEAGVLRGALDAEGISTEIVPETSLPILPPVKFVNRLDCLPEALMIYDPLNRGFPLEWRHIWLIAVGKVRVQNFERLRTERDVLRFDGRGGPRMETRIDYSTRERAGDQMLIEVLVGQGALRYSGNGEKLFFTYLGERRTAQPQANFTMLVRDMVRHAPHAALNRGAWYLRDHDDLFAYPSKNAFYEELTWLLWHLSKPIA